MKTEITMQKQDLINMITKSLTNKQVQDIKIKDIVVTVVLKDGKKEDFEEIRFSMEM